MKRASLPYRTQWLIALTLVLCLSISFETFSQRRTGRKPVNSKTSVNFDEEFVGPFDSWANVKRDYGAVGDGKADDTEALQKALDALKDPKKAKVLFLPAGTYRITKGLTMVSVKDIGVVGEDPATTTILWDGPKDGTMLDCNGVSYSRFGRITWDGAGKAGTAVNHGWDGKVPSANTNGEHADEVFKDLGFGIRAGTRGKMDAECPVLRCKFIRCSKAGLSIETFNALDWFVWYCYFEDCLYGVTNTYGAGNYSVNYSLFRNSKEADIAMGHCSYFSIRHNTSINSKAFFFAHWRSCSGVITIQGNTIYNPTGPNPILVGNQGPCLLMDNVVKASREKKSLVNVPQTTLAVGNQFTSDSALVAAQKGSSITEIQNKVIPFDKAEIKVPVLPPTPANRKRQIFEIKPGSTAEVIQAAIDEAVQLRGKHPVIHFPTGQYAIDKTLSIPANADVQLIGDGLTTQLNWTGQQDGPMLRLAGPSRALLRDMHIVGNGNVEGVVVEKCDQTGARVFMQQGNSKGNGKGNKGIGLLAEGLDNADVSLHNFYHSGCKEVGVKVIGGPKMTFGKKVEGRVAIFCGASSNNNLSYDLYNGANLLATDIWYEGAPPRFIHLTEKNSGTFTLNGAKVATGRPGPDMEAKDPNFAALEIDGFKGNFTIINAIIGTKMGVTGDSRNANIFSMAHGTENYFSNRSDNARAALLASTKYTPGGGGVAIANQGTANAPFVLKMLSQLRREIPRPITPLAKGLTDFRVYRVNVSNCSVSWHLKAD